MTCPQTPMVQTHPRTFNPKTFTDPVLNTAMQDRAAYQRLHAHISRVWEDAACLKVLGKWNSQMDGLTEEEIGGAPGKLRLLILCVALISAIEFPHFAEEYQPGDAGHVLNAFWGRADREDLTAYQRILFRSTSHRVMRIHKLLIARCAGLCPHCGHEAGKGLRCQTCNRFLDGEVAA